MFVLQEPQIRRIAFVWFHFTDRQKLELLAENLLYHQTIESLLALDVPEIF
jgi:hypothetical protein